MTADIKRLELPINRRYCRPIEAAQTTGLAKSTIMAALWSGQLEAYRVGRAWVIPVDALDRWIRGGGEVAA